MWKKYSSVPLLVSISSLFFTNIPILTPITCFNQHLAIVATSNTQKYCPITILVSYTTTHITQPQKLFHEGRLAPNNIRRQQLILSTDMGANTPLHAQDSSRTWITEAQH